MQNTCFLPSPWPVLPNTAPLAEKPTKRQKVLLGNKRRVRKHGREPGSSRLFPSPFNEWGPRAPDGPGAATCLWLFCRRRGVRFRRSRGGRTRGRENGSAAAGLGSACTARSRGTAASGRGCAGETDGRAAWRRGRGRRPGLGLPWVPGRRPRPRDQPGPRSGLTCWAEPGVAARARSGRGPRAMPCTDWPWGLPGSQWRPACAIAPPRPERTSPLHGLWFWELNWP